MRATILQRSLNSLNAPQVRSGSELLAPLRHQESGAPGEDTSGKSAIVHPLLGTNEVRIQGWDAAGLCQESS